MRKSRRKCKLKSKVGRSKKLYPRKGSVSYCLLQFAESRSQGLLYLWSQILHVTIFVLGLQIVMPCLRHTTKCLVRSQD